MQVQILPASQEAVAEIADALVKRFLKILVAAINKICAREFVSKDK
jgi:hypothetical protein